MKKYRKPTNSDVICNYWAAVTPKKYKNATLTGDIFRAFYTTSNEQNLNDALDKLTVQYCKNRYPKNLVERKIKEVKSRNFTSRSNKKEYQDLIRAHPEQYHTLSLAFTSNECEQKGYDIAKMLKEITPNYHVNIAWSNEKLAKFYSTRLKLSTPSFNKIGILYKFECSGCSSKYIGETKRQLTNRIAEHGNEKHNSAISKHVYNCEKYKEKLYREYSIEATQDQKIEFITRNFSIIQSNLSNYNRRKTVEALEIKLKKNNFK